jgi:hypothetical protein
LVLETIALPLSYSGIGAKGWVRTTDATAFNGALYLLSYFGFGKMVPARGLEPRTVALRERCSAVELRRLNFSRLS